MALVTGASSGIGLELAKLFASNGYDLIIVAEDAGINAAAETLRSLGPMVESVQGDLARDGFDALMAGKDHFVAGSFKNKVQSTMAQVTPDKVTAEMHRKLSEPGSASKVKNRDRDANP